MFKSKEQKNYVKNIIFDFDGVILDSVKLKNKAFQKIVECYQPSIRKKFLKFHNNNLGISRKVKLKYLEKILSDDDKHYDAKTSKKLDKILSSNLKKASLIPGIISFLKKNKGLNLFISSGTPEAYLKKKCLEKNIYKYFKRIMGTPRSKNQHILDLKNKFIINKNNTIFFGDSMTDLKVAVRHKFNFIQVGNNLNSKKVNLRIKNFKDKKLKKYQLLINKIN